MWTTLVTWPKRRPVCLLSKRTEAHGHAEELRKCGSFVTTNVRKVMVAQLPQFHCHEQTVHVTNPLNKNKKHTI